jgi:translation initiation factor 1 (eIF-1/SUI1)
MATTEKINVWLPPDQVAWLKSKKQISETVRALITEAMNMEKLAASVKKKAAGGGSRDSKAPKKK